MTHPRGHGIGLAFGAMACLLLAGCGTLKGADAAFMNLVGPSTQSQVQGRYLDTADVRQYYKLDPQRVTAQRLSYDGMAIPAGEIRQHNVVLIPPLQALIPKISVFSLPGFTCALNCFPGIGSRKKYPFLSFP